MSVYDLREPNPYPEHITDAQWWFWEQLHAMEPTTQLGGFYANKPGYHNKRRNLVAQGRDHGVNDPDTDYSIRRAVDRRGPDNRAAALDWSFPEAWSRDYRRAAKYGARVRAAFNRRDPRLAGWREFLGQTDTDKSVAGEGLDFHTWTTRTPDSSHETHHHFSEDRDQVGSFENKAKMISILAGFDSVAAWLASREDDDMFTDKDRSRLENLYQGFFFGGISCGTEVSPNNGRAPGNSMVNKADALLARPAVQPAPVDVDQLAAALGPHIEAAAERAVRRVLGAVDGATPAGG